MSAAPQSLTKVYEELVLKGWRESPNANRKYARCFFKRHDTPSRCFGNSDKAGITVQIAVTDWHGLVSMELEVCGGLSDNSWLTLLNYSLPKTVTEVEALIPRLLRIWEAANTTP